MRPARLAPLLLLPLLVAGLGGCTAYNDLVRFIDRAQGRPEFAEVERLNDEIAFARTDPPTQPPTPGKLTTLNFTVPEAAAALRVDVAVDFEEVPNLPPVSGVPQGRVVVELRGPGGVAGSATFNETDVQTFSPTPPRAGTWGVQVHTLGQGRVRVVALVTEPVR